MIRNGLVVKHILAALFIPLVAMSVIMVSSKCTAADDYRFELKAEELSVSADGPAGPSIDPLATCGLCS